MCVDVRPNRRRGLMARRTWQGDLGLCTQYLNNLKVQTEKIPPSFYRPSLAGLQLRLRAIRFLEALRLREAGRRMARPTAGGRVAAGGASRRRLVAAGEASGRRAVAGETAAGGQAGDDTAGGRAMAGGRAVGGLL